MTESKREPFKITDADIGRYVRRKSTGEVSKVSRDPGNGWPYPGSIYYEWRQRHIIDDLEYVVVSAPGEDPEREALIAALREISNYRDETIHLSPDAIARDCIRIARAALASAQEE